MIFFVVALNVRMSYLLWVVVVLLDVWIAKVSRHFRVFPL